MIRGEPQEKCEVHHNWFLKQHRPADAVEGLSEKTRAFNNVMGSIQPRRSELGPSTVGGQKGTVPFSSAKLGQSPWATCRAVALETSPFPR